MKYRITVEGIPKPQPRPRMTKRGHAYNPSSADDWKNSVIAKMAGAGLFGKCIDGPLSLNITFFMPVPKRRDVEDFAPYDKTPDIDNLVKAVMDAMNDCNVWEDDRQVYRLSAVKVCHGKPGCIIEIF